MKKIAITTLFFSSIVASQASVLVDFNFDTGATDPDDNENLTIGSASADPGLTATDISSAGGLNFFRVRTPSPDGDAYTSLAFLASSDDAFVDSDTSFTNNNYFEFTLTADSGNLLNLTSLDFDVTRGGTDNIRTWIVRTDLTTGDFASGTPAGVRTGSTPASDAEFSNESIDLTGINFQGISSVTFQIALTRTTGDGDSATHGLDFDNIVVNGAVVPVPEPSTYAIFAGALALGLVMLRRRR